MFAGSRPTLRPWDGHLEGTVELREGGPHTWPLVERLPDGSNPDLFSKGTLAGPRDQIARNSRPDCFSIGQVCLLQVLVYGAHGDLDAANNRCKYHLADKLLAGRGERLNLVRPVSVT